MSDLIERLRDGAGLAISHPHLALYVEQRLEAAAELERLQIEIELLANENERLRNSVDRWPSLMKELAKCERCGWEGRGDEDCGS